MIHILVENSQQPGGNPLFHGVVWWVLPMTRWVLACGVVGAPHDEMGVEPVVWCGWHGAPHDEMGVELVVWLEKSAVGAFHESGIDTGIFEPLVGSYFKGDT